jgi:hypothetical protein
MRASRMVNCSSKKPSWSLRVTYKVYAQATAMLKEIERREKPEQDKLQADIKVYP